MTAAAQKKKKEKNLEPQASLKSKCLFRRTNRSEPGRLGQAVQSSFLIDCFRHIDKEKEMKREGNVRKVKEKRRKKRRKKEEKGGKSQIEMTERNKK